MLFEDHSLQFKSVRSLLEVRQSVRSLLEVNQKLSGVLEVIVGVTYTGLSSGFGSYQSTVLKRSVSLIN